MLLLIAAATFVTVLLLCIVIVTRVTADEQKVKDRLKIYVQSEVVTASGENESTGGIARWRALVRQASKCFESQQISRLLEHKLVQAGWPLRGSEFLVICIAASFVCFCLLVLLLGKVWVSCFAALLAGGIPFIGLKVQIDKRVKAFNDLLGDALVLMANSLRTGYSFMQAMEMVSREMPRPISVEFGRTLREMNLGITTEEALNNLAKRVNSDDLELVITAVLIQRQVGGNLAEILDNIADTIRQRVKIKGEIKTLTAQGKISGIIIGIMPFLLGVVIYAVNPEYIAILFTKPMGKVLLIGALVSELIGILFIRKIVNIEV